MKNNVKKTVLGLMLLCCCIFLSACEYGKLAYVDTSVTKIGGIKVQLGEVDKKVFISGTDSEERLNRFGEVGEITQINILVKGKIDADSLNAKSTPLYDQNNNVIGYTEYFKLKLRMPKNAVKLDRLDGNGASQIDFVKNEDDGHFYENISFIRGDENKSNWQIVGSSETSDNYLYYGFCDENNEVIAEYFVHIVYEVEFI